MNEQFELYENAKKRIKQKKRLYFHFIIFLIGSVFLIVLNKLLKIGEPYDWFVWAIIGWFFLFIIHFVNVFVTNRFMGKEWEQKQVQKLVLKQEKRIEKLEKELAYQEKLKVESIQFADDIKKNEPVQKNQINE